MKTLTKRDFSLLIANALDYFDTSIYGFLAPLLGPVFFPDHSPLVQLILVYSVLGSSLITKPLGTFLFGRMARNHGPLYGLSYSLIGVSMATVCIGFLPGQGEIGGLAPLCLVLLRMIKGVFAAGESTIARLYIMESKPEREALITSHFYQSSSMVGMVMASAAASLVMAVYPEAWRVCFFLGGITGAVGYFLRRSAQDSISLKKESPFDTYHVSQLRSLWRHRSSLICVAVVMGYSCLTYSVPYIFMNNFIPLITDHSMEAMTAINTALLVIDMVLIPLIGRFTLRYKGEAVMMTASLVLALSFVPLFLFLPQASLGYVIFVRAWIIFWGVVFLCPLTFWCKSLFPLGPQYLLVGMGCALGSGTLGRFTVPFCLWLWHTSPHPLWPSLYMAVVSLLTAGTIYLKKKSSSKRLVSQQTEAIPFGAIA